MQYLTKNKGLPYITHKIILETGRETPLKAVKALVS